MTIQDLKKKSVEELKVIAYDTQIQLEGLRQSLQVINQLIAEKPEPKSEPKDVKTK